MEVMRRYSNCRIGFAAFLLLVFATGCSDHDKPGENPTVTAPTVSSVAPLDAASGACSSTVVTATFSAAMNPASIDGVTFTLTGPGTAAVAGVVSYSASSNTATFTPTSTLALGTIYTATITTGATDAYGIALASNYVWAFTTGTSPCAPPAVASEIPANAATGVCPATVVTATFSEAMNAATISATTFTLAGPGTTAVAGAVSYAGSTATFTPSSALALNTVYTATITTGAQDPSGNALAANFVWTFTTSTTACAAPTVVSVAPANGATAICPNTLLTATFSEAMQSSTINGTTFTLTGPGTTSVPGTVTYVGSSDVATFSPTSPLALNTLYTATITTGAQDLAGDRLATDSPHPPPHARRRKSRTVTARTWCGPRIVRSKRKRGGGMREGKEDADKERRRATETTEGSGANTRCEGGGGKGRKKRQSEKPPRHGEAGESDYERKRARQDESPTHRTPAHGPNRGPPERPAQTGARMVETPTDTRRPALEQLPSVPILY